MVLHTSEGKGASAAAAPERRLLQRKPHGAPSPAPLLPCPCLRARTPLRLGSQSPATLRPRRRSLVVPFSPLPLLTARPPSAPRRAPPAAAPASTSSTSATSATPPAPRRAPAPLPKCPPLPPPTLALTLPSSPRPSQGWELSGLLRTYALYLEERVACFEGTGFDPDSDRTSSATIREWTAVQLTEKLPKLQLLLRRLVAVVPQGSGRVHPVVAAAVAQTFRDSKKVYRAISDGIVNLVDRFFDMPQHEAAQARARTPRPAGPHSPARERRPSRASVQSEAVVHPAPLPPSLRAVHPLPLRSPPHPPLPDPPSPPPPAPRPPPSPARRSTCTSAPCARRTSSRAPTASSAGSTSSGLRSTPRSRSRRCAGAAAAAGGESGEGRARAPAPEKRDACGPERSSRRARL